ncbi:MAG: hypothetical protein JWM98_1857 [Thermoleophilia bacterium]|nr:hypothetical protein [Thermoleophilia bacterium]
MDARDDAHGRFPMRACRLAAHLDGALDETMLDAIQGVWTTLEHAAADAPAHARAVRSRMFWESLAPGGAAAAPGLGVTPLELVPAWDGSAADADDRSEDEAGEEFASAEAA